MALAMRVVCDKEGDGNSGKNNDDKDGGQVTATKWVMAMVMRRAGDKEGKGKGGKGNGDGDEGSG